MNRIIALWTHPRSISTAFERVMIERGDFKVLHEPFSYLYYVHEGKSSIDQEYVDPDHPRTYPEIKNYILSTAAEKPVFFKDMCSHCCDFLIRDPEFLTRLTNTFLIRHPEKAIASYYALNPHVTRNEIGYAQLLSVFNQVDALTHRRPVIMDADDLEDDPEGIVAAYCRALDIAFIPESLQWEPEHKNQWDIWKDWHTDAARSTGIQKNMEQFDVTVKNSPLLRSYYDYHLPFYRKLYPQRLTRQSKPATHSEMQN